MSDLPVYVIANLSDIHDPDTYRKYEKGFFPILKKHGGEFVTFDDKSHTFEGDSPIKGRIILFKFPSEDAAKGWYDDPEYQAISEHRRAGVKTGFLAMVHTLPPRN